MGRKGHVIWPATEGGAIALTAGQMSYLLEGIDWRNPQQTWRPTSARGELFADKYCGIRPLKREANQRFCD
ncbi:hypothetical protein ILFOPFJJ_06297 [Ensifer psoraleae]|uniref:hypothetical protein n=1 Tax=Sinorhizobium psoraleae TaxID=520838 RepID=UPI001569EA29|nr:hypothetical protein [Sinorhizobium psoraleae]NRP75374.1 hypothetical protein [Sinorhizobium psoraleae]